MALISFNFDGTLSDESQQAKAAEFIKNGHEIWITENRNITDDNTDVFSVADKLGIPKTQIQLIGDKSKIQFLRDFDIHFDSKQESIEAINSERSPCVALLISEPKPPVE